VLALRTVTYCTENEETPSTTHKNIFWLASFLTSENPIDQYQKSKGIWTRFSIGVTWLEAHWHMKLNAMGIK
jgi:hypothetical protein